MPIEKFSVSNDPSIYEAWPDLIKTEGGKLICVFTECKHHLDRDDSRIVMVESTDRGRTWSKKKPFTDVGTKENYFNNARISRLRDGNLVVVCDKVQRDENSSSQIYVWYGDKEGTTWSQAEIHDFCGIVPDKMKELENGRRILAAHFYNPETKKLEQYLWYSDDGGKTWSDRVTVAADPRYNLCEVSLLECENNTLVAFMRENSGLGYDMLKCISSDNGETWSDIYEVPADGAHRPVAGYLNDGTVMVTYRYIPRGTTNVFAAFLRKKDLLQTERQKQAIRIMPLDYDRNPSPDLGYTGWVQWEDDEIYVVNYIKDDADKGQIRGYSFYPRDVVLPQTENTSPNVF